MIDALPHIRFVRASLDACSSVIGVVRPLGTNEWEAIYARPRAESDKNLGRFPSVSSATAAVHSHHKKVAAKKGRS